MKRRTFGLAMLMAAACPSFVLAADGSEPERQARWIELSQSIFGDRPIQPGMGLISIEAPARAMDAALVPITLRIEKRGVKAVHLVIDDNPSPYAANVSFGPAGDPSKLSLRVRINGYTNVHAVAETTDGRLYQASVFVKASGGCSAPISVSDQEAMKSAGEMRMKFPNGSNEATLMIRHPNFSGMQMNQVTRTYTPARYLEAVKVSHGGKMVFELAGDISLSSDPVIGFAYAPSGDGEFRVEATETEGGRWEQSFAVPPQVN
jgi:sulfur-oxidizing protein SoxY